MAGSHGDSHAVTGEMNLLLGLGLGAVTGGVGYRLGLLSRSGTIAVVLVGVFAFGAGGWIWGALSLVFFVSSGLWSRFRARYKKSLSERFDQGARRNWGQVLARLGWSVALALSHALGAESTGVFVAFAGAIATATADAWATELGVLSAQAPRLLVSRRRVPAGTPGAISITGVLAAVGGSWLIGFSALLLKAIGAWLDRAEWDPALLWLPLTAMIGGVTGSLLDSFLGATAQGIFYCERCDKETEERIHTCGEPARQIRGWAWLTNDGINLASSAVDAAVAAGVFAWLAQTRMRW